MQDLNIPLNARQWAQVTEALASLNEGEPATPAQVALWVCRQLRSEVLHNESKKANNASDRSIRQALKGEGW
ncbi:hypothetical protein LCGC14_0423390 [marine sediment metagenome]|uniref:Uncharacterized protein n=1 Tax=marine sediment metagenome TaxID=412755 RepID=A0A0F9VC80_9ZZZZ